MKVVPFDQSIHSYLMKQNIAIRLLKLNESNEKIKSHHNYCP